MARLYADENFPFPVVEELRRLGHDVLTLQEAGYGGKAIPDEVVLADAIRGQRMLVTINRKHFIALHKASSNHAGIVVCSFDPRFVEQAHRIHQALEAFKGELEGQLLRINRPHSL
ncbi:MAG: DUF5615 family PIN-like protein [Desulfobacteraceae bacterium]